MYFSYGFPKSLLTGAGGADSEAIYASASPAGDLLLVVFNATVQARSLASRMCWEAACLLERYAALLLVLLVPLLLAARQCC